MVWPLGRHGLIYRMKSKRRFRMMRQVAVALISLVLLDTPPKGAAVSCMAACGGSALAWAQNALGIAGI